MQKLWIEGGRRLSGEIRVSGAKNAALPALAAALLTAEPVRLERIPDVVDIRTMTRLLETMGGQVERRNGVLTVAARTLAEPEAPYAVVKTMRASSLVLGPLVARCGRARVSLPGGCAIGARPINLHLEGLRQLGAEVRIEGGYVEATAPRGLRGGRIAFPRVTVTGTEDLMMAAALARGETVLENAAREPEVEDVARLLSAMGARIEGAGSATIRIEGVESLRGAAHRIIPDRIEAGTFLAAGALAGADLRVVDLEPKHLEAVVDGVRRAGARIREETAAIVISAADPLVPVDITTGEHPGFPTDMQAQWMALMAFADGDSTIVETIFENRFMHASELMRMGARIDLDGRRAIVRGGRRLSGTTVMASDLRASASLVLAALGAHGETVIDRVYHLDRGYERLDEKLCRAGAAIRRLQNSSTAARAG